MSNDTTPPTHQGDRHWSQTLSSPIGDLTLVATAQGLCAVLWPVDGESERTGIAAADDAVAAPDTAARVLSDAARQLDEYFAGERTEFDLPLDPTGTDFQQQAWTVLRDIEFGATISYGEQAQRLGNPKASRAVGAANGKNPISIIVPCHRVVGRDGSLTGFAGGADTKRWLLDHEARVAGHRLV